MTKFTVSPICPGPVPSDNPATVRCSECAHASWTLTPTGRIKRSGAGRCKAPLPELPVLMAATRKPIYSVGGIWSDREGHCDFFQPKENPDGN